MRIASIGRKNPNCLCYNFGYRGKNIVAAFRCLPAHHATAGEKDFLVTQKEKRA